MMDKLQLQQPTRMNLLQRPSTQLRILAALGIFSAVWILSQLLYTPFITTVFHKPPPHAASILSRCHSLKTKAGPPLNFSKRSQSDRFVHGTNPVLLKGAKIWTGWDNGTEVFTGDVLMAKGIIKSVGHLSVANLNVHYGSQLVVIDAKGAWVTPGIVDIHAHLGDASSPELSGAVDDNSLKGTIQPWLRSLDGLNTHDESYLLSIAGGVTTSLILPGSANAIGGQAFVIKLRETDERTPTSMLVEPPYQINNSSPDPSLPHRWRHMKHACGENPSDVYHDTRMDTNWAFRQAYNRARKLKESQDEYCSLAVSGKWKGLGQFPEDLQWEALVDVIRGRVKVNVHCYEAVDLDNLVRLSNEFKFPIAAFHHASEAYLVPDLIKRAYGKPPAVALFATNSRYKREAYRSSEFAPRILAEHGLTVLMKSDHPVLNSRYLLYEAQQAHFYGLPENLALASVTSNSAEVMGLGHRIGYIKEGWDADLVIWDSHPMALGATPTQVFIDGIPQLDSAFVVHKPDNFQKSPKVPKFDQEARDAVKYEGLPPLKPKPAESNTIIFSNVKEVFTGRFGSVERLFAASDSTTLGTVVCQNGTITCSGNSASCITPSISADLNAVTVDLQGGSILPGLISFGSPLGLQHIDQEPSTNDGDVHDPLIKPIPKILGGDTSIIRAADGLMYGSRDALLAYRAGVTTAITAPSHKKFYGGLGAFFSLGASQKMENGALIQDATSVHISIKHFSKTPSISTQVAALRRLLLGPLEGSSGNWFRRVREGQIPLVVEAHSADVIATLILLKMEVEAESRRVMKLTITGAEEAHLLADELARADVGIILNPSRPFPAVWESRRILPGPPLTKDSAIAYLLSKGVTVGLGCQEIWSARNLPFDVAWAAIESGGQITKEEAIALGSTNVAKLLGAELDVGGMDLVATVGGDLFEMSSKPIAIISPRRGSTDFIN